MLLVIVVVLVAKAGTAVKANNPISKKALKIQTVNFLI
jgi:hypothetical protein